MILYHGSNIAVLEPRIIITNRSLDFGAGFYTTSDKNQAIRWAKLQTLRRGTGIPSVTIYNLDETAVQSLSVLRFSQSDGDWLSFVAQNRKGTYCGPQYDIVCGPVANDNTMPVISDYISGTISEGTALILLKPQKLADQYAFLTSKALTALSFTEVLKDE